ncbi:MAG: P-II family nitrogen regulator [Planctomycetes bacterium]|nr:P-II family nitrogen regulator [Planctomycetota bacterium]MCC8117113.1 P-II family nitrogen regulator [Planctomycetota bacterium]
MQNFVANPAKMLICFLGRHRGERLVEAAKEAGARGGTLALGQSLGNSRILQALSLGDIQQDIVYLVMGDEAPAVIQAVRDAAAADPRRLSGMAVRLAVPELIVRTRDSQRFFRHGGGSARIQLTSPVDQGEKPMQSGYKMINVIVNSGFADDVMAEARKAGASGGTIINARGTGKEEDAKFFGIALVPEKEMLIIIAREETVPNIVEAIATVPTLSQPGGGIIFNLNVEEFILLGQHKTWREEEGTA